MGKRSNHSPAVADKLFECVSPFCGFGAKGKGLRRQTDNVL